MKFLTLIFSLYLLGLTFVPCSDDIECKEKSSTTISATSQHGNHTQDTESCTPMCHCSCCAVSAFCQPTIGLILPNKFFPSVKYTGYEISYASQTSFSIWQPPKKA